MTSHVIFQLRVTLDRESQNDNATIRWSTDGSSFIIIDQNRFEEVGILDDVWYDVLATTWCTNAVDVSNPSWWSLLLLLLQCIQQETIPTYFGNPIVFASFLRKLQRWGFTRVSSRRSGRYEFCLPTFRRLGADSAPTAVATSADGISFWKVAKARWWWGILSSTCCTYCLLLLENAEEGGARLYWLWMLMLFYLKV